MLYSSESSALAALAELGNGWVVVPYDNPAAGLSGYAAIARDGGPDAAEHMFQWPLFGQPLTPDVQEVSAKALIGFLREESLEFLQRCDNPMLRLLGVVSYRQAAEGRSMVRQTSLTEVRALSAEDRQELMRALNHRERFYGERLEAAEALSTHSPVD